MKYLLSKYIFLLKSGRISVAGLTSKNVSYVAKIIDEAVRAHPSKYFKNISYDFSVLKDILLIQQDGIEQYDYCFLFFSIMLETSPFCSRSWRYAALCSFIASIFIIWPLSYNQLSKLSSLLSFFVAFCHWYADVSFGLCVGHF